MDPDFSNVLRLLAEKMGLTPAEFDAATIVIQDGNVRVMPDDCESEADVPDNVEIPNARGDR